MFTIFIVNKGWVKIEKGNNKGASKREFGSLEKRKKSGVTEPIQHKLIIYNVRSISVNFV